MQLCLNKFLNTSSYDDMGCVLMLPELKTQKETFLFCFELFCKCLVILYGIQNRLNLNELRIQDLDYVKTKMKKLCVKVNTIQYDIQTAKLLDMNINSNLLQTSWDVIMSQKDDDPLSNYIIQVQVGETVMEISFEMYFNQHNILNYKE
tara:strand:+ start:227 stop:673 length:447 start_codon:yes stop_codon:yes gene_type:complete